MREEGSGIHLNRASPCFPQATSCI